MGLFAIILSKILMLPEEIYNLFKQELDGEEFESDEDAQRAMNVAYRKILAERDWEILRRTAALTNPSLAAITDLDKVLDVWAGGVELKRANYRDRFKYDQEKDYYVDLANNQIGFIHSGVWQDCILTIDYKYRPDDLDLSSTDEPIFPDTYCPRIAYEMVLAYKRGDESFDGYREVERKNQELEDLMVDWDSSLTID